MREGETRDVKKDDFAEEGKHQWTLNHNDYRVVVRKNADAIELVIWAKITGDPDFKDWDHVLKTINVFYRRKRIAEGKEG